MSLALKLGACIKDSCSVMRVTEMTGLYNANFNLTGWDDSDVDNPDNTTNPDKSGITSSTLQVKGPNQTSYTTFTLTSTITSSSAYVEEFTLVDITPSDLGLSSFTGGNYEFIYTVTDAGIEYTKKVKVPFFCAQRCCVDKMYKQLLADWCGCDDCGVEDALKEIMIAESLLSGLEKSADCLTQTKIDEILVCIERICNIDDCGCN